MGSQIILLFKVSVLHLQKWRVYRSSLCLFYAVGLSFQRFLESISDFRTDLLKKDIRFSGILIQLIGV